MVHVAELQDRGNQRTLTYSVKVSGYITPSVTHQVAMLGQPRTHPFFHRPLHMLLGAAFETGFVLDGVEERAFPPDFPDRAGRLHWGPEFSEIPPVLVARVRNREIRESGN